MPQQYGEVRVLTAEDVLFTYKALIEFFRKTPDPFAPVGYSTQLLESAVGRQIAGIGGSLHRHDPVENACTLAYGIIKDHPFNNGNKRTALVSLLWHLEINGHKYCGSHDDLYRMVLDVSNGAFDKSPNIDPEHEQLLKLAKKYACNGPVELMATWMQRSGNERMRPVKKGEKVIRYRELRSILNKFGYTFDNPHGGYVDIVPTQAEKPSLFSRIFRRSDRKCRIPYPGDNQTVSIDTMKDVRRLCHLSYEDGVDYGTFYEGSPLIDDLINQYSTIIRRLARR